MVQPPPAKRTMQHYRIDLLKESPDFFRRLRSLCPVLTTHDVDACVVICLDVPKQEILRDLSYDEGTWGNRRWRLRKMFGLKEKESLALFLKAL